MNFSKLLSTPLALSRFKYLGESRSGFTFLKLGLSLKLLLIVVGISLIGVLASSFLVLTLQRQQLIDSAETATVRE
jgi:hypothetical protein